MSLSNNLPEATLLLRQLGFVLMIEAQRYLVCVVLGFIAWIWWRRKAGSNVRLQSRPIHRSQLAREMFYSATSILVFALVSIVIMVASGKSHRFFYAHFADHGWPYFVLSILIMMGVQDTYFYWTHRLMHHRALFRFFHRTHHLSTNPNPLTTYSINPLEAVVDAGGSILILFFVPKHIVAYLIFTWVNTAYAVYGHLGHEILPASWGGHWFGRWINTSVAHNIHHARARYHFGWYFLFWDRWMNTIDPDYEAQMQARRVAARTPFNSATQ